MQVVQAIAAFVERIKVAIFESILLTNFKSTLGNSIKSYISVIVFLKESLVQLALWKAVVIGFFRRVLYNWSFLLLKQSALK